jgi:hypothetical protein
MYEQFPMSDPDEEELDEIEILKKELRKLKMEIGKMEEKFKEHVNNMTIPCQSKFIIGLYIICFVFFAYSTFFFFNYIDVGNFEHLLPTIGTFNNIAITTYLPAQNIESLPNEIKGIGYYGFNIKKYDYLYSPHLHREKAKIFGIVQEKNGNEFGGILFQTTNQTNFRNTFQILDNELQFNENTIFSQGKKRYYFGNTDFDMMIFSKNDLEIFADGNGMKFNYKGLSINSLLIRMHLESNFTKSINQTDINERFDKIQILQNKGDFLLDLKSLKKLFPSFVQTNQVKLEQLVYLLIEKTKSLSKELQILKEKCLYENNYK